MNKVFLIVIFFLPKKAEIIYKILKLLRQIARTI